MPFNPAAYALRPEQALEKLEKRRAFEKENEHLSVPFFVKGLENIIPKQYPGETSFILARSFEGKSTVLKAWASACEQEVTRKNADALTVEISHEDTAEISTEQQLTRYENEMQYISSQRVYIGRSFGMSQDDIAELHLTNIARIMVFVRDELFATQKRFAGIFYDYIQRTPFDPERRNMADDRQMRLQIRDNTIRLCNAATTFQCPLIFASQAPLKQSYTLYSPEMPIPGSGDTDESKDIFQIPDRAYGWWAVNLKYPTPGQLVESGGWRFQSAPNLFFLRCLKFRYYQPDSKKDHYAPAGRVFPVFADDKGNFYYDPDFHKASWIGAPGNV